jgi:hypothetical protein
MATILEFRKPTGRALNRPQGGTAAGPARIFIFPGIRVSYWDEVFGADNSLPPAPTESSRRGKRKSRR